MKMLYIKTSDFDNSTVGGSITHTIGMINGFLDNGIEEDVLLRKSLSLINANQIELQINAQKKPFLIGDWIYHRNFYKKAIKEIKKSNKKYDFLYYRHRLMCFTGNKISKKLHIKSVCEFNSFYSKNYKNIMVPAAVEKHGAMIKIPLELTSGLVTFLLESFEKKVLKNADIIVTVSQVLKNELIEFGIENEKILVLPNGVDPCFFMNQPIKAREVRKKYDVNLRQKIVGFAATFSSWHGIEELTEAILNIRDDDIIFFLIGDGMLRKKMQNRLKNQNNVHFLGKIAFNEMPNYLSACDILIVANSWNANDKRPFFGSPTKLFEYMAMGKAIVASDLEQIGMILKHDETALLFASGNVDEMVSSIRKLSKDDELRKKLGSNARDVVCNNYTWSINAHKVIEKVLSIGEEK